jgi:hypothetical protein
VTYNKYDNWTSDKSSDFLDFHSEEWATVSRAWLWRVHFLKVTVSLRLIYGMVLTGVCHRTAIHRPL